MIKCNSLTPELLEPLLAVKRDFEAIGKVFKIELNSLFDDNFAHPDQIPSVTQSWISKFELTKSDKLEDFFKLVKSGNKHINLDKHKVLGDDRIGSIL